MDSKSIQAYLNGIQLLHVISVRFFRFIWDRSRRREKSPLVKYWNALHSCIVRWYHLTLYQSQFISLARKRHQPTCNLQRCFSIFFTRVSSLVSVTSVDFIGFNFSLSSIQCKWNGAPIKITNTIGMINKLSIELISLSTAVLWNFS